MAYTPKPDREVKDGKAVVSAKELAAFKSQYGEDKSLRDLLNMDKGLRRKGEGSAPAPVKETVSAKVDAPAKVDASAKVDAPAPAEEKPYRQKNLTDLLGLSSNVRKTTAETTSKEDSKEASGDKKSWWTTPNANLQRGSLPSGKEIRAALGSSYKKGGSVSASSRGDGIAQRGKTRGKMC